MYNISVEYEDINMIYEDSIRDTYRILSIKKLYTIYNRYSLQKQNMLENKNKK